MCTQRSTGSSSHSPNVVRDGNKSKGFVGAACHSLWPPEFLSGGIYYLLNFTEPSCVVNNLALMGTYWNQLLALFHMRWEPEQNTRTDLLDTTEHLPFSRYPEWMM